VIAEFRDPDQAGRVDPLRDQVRSAPAFQTSDKRHAWLNGVLAIGCGERRDRGIRHGLFAIA
jgi:hypothetical protein